MSVRHVAVVLAAGGSRRLGQPKQLLTRDGETLVRRALRLAATTQPVRLLLVVGADATAVAASASGVACEILHNAGWQDGLGSSLQTAARALQESTAPVLLLGCDQPALTADHLQALVASAAWAASGCAASAYGGLVGVPAVVPGAWLGDGGGAGGDHGFGARLRGLPADTLARLDAPEFLFDIDTPDDLVAAVAGGWVDAPGLP